jgi:hypothetical protein
MCGDGKIKFYFALPPVTAHEIVSCIVQEAVVPFSGRSLSSSNEISRSRTFEDPVSDFKIALSLRL